MPSRQNTVFGELQSCWVCEVFKGTSFPQHWVSEGGAQRGSCAGLVFPLPGEKGKSYRAIKHIERSHFSRKMRNCRQCSDFPINVVKIVNVSEDEVDEQECWHYSCISFVQVLCNN